MKKASKNTKSANKKQEKDKDSPTGGNPENSAGAFMNSLIPYLDKWLSESLMAYGIRREPWAAP